MDPNHIYGTLFAVITQSLHNAINFFPPTGYLHAGLINGSHVFFTEKGNHAQIVHQMT